MRIYDNNLDERYGLTYNDHQGYKKKKRNGYKSLGPLTGLRILTYKMNF